MTFDAVFILVLCLLGLVLFVRRPFGRRRYPHAPIVHAPPRPRRAGAQAPSMALLKAALRNDIARIKRVFMPFLDGIVWRDMSSSDEEDGPYLGTRRLPAPPQNQELGTRNQPEPVITMSSRRVLAIALLYNKGVSPEVIAGVINHDHEAFISALGAGVGRGVLAVVAGGNRQATLREIADAAEVERARRLKELAE